MAEVCGGRAGLRWVAEARNTVFDVNYRRAEMSSNVVYAIVKAGGRQEKVAVGDVVVVDRLAAQAGSTVELPALLLVDGEKVTTDAAALAKVTVTAEVVRDEKGPKIDILKYKNKTGYRKRQGHRQQLTRLKVTGIN
jgi:large subunit ribosomal protein L21